MSATNPPSPFFSGTVISWPAVKDDVHAVPVCSTRRRWSLQTNFWWSLRTSAPGSRCDSHSTWKPLQMPRTGIPPSAARTTSVMTGAKRAMAPQRR